MPDGHQGGRGANLAEYRQNRDRPTRTAVTELRYMATAKGLVARCAKEIAIPEPSPKDFVDWLVSIRPTLARASWRQYRAAAVHMLRSRATVGAGQAADRLEREGHEGCRKSGERGHGYAKVRQGGIPAADRTRLLGRLGSGRLTPTKASLHYWLKAGMLTGLRRHEWFEAEWLDRLPADLAAQLPVDLASLGPIPPPPADLPERFRASWGPAISAAGPWLRVRNAKNTNGRSHGGFRYLDLSPLSEADRTTIRKWLGVVQGHVRSGKADRLIQRCTESLSRINESLWPRREAGYTLYAARHQFAANAKAVAVNPAYVGALMGHAVDKTSCSHYARRQRNEVFRPMPDGTWTISGVPRPLPGDVLRVREIDRVDLASVYRRLRGAGPADAHAADTHAAEGQAAEISPD